MSSLVIQLWNQRIFSSNLTWCTCSDHIVQCPNGFNVPCFCTRKCILSCNQSLLINWINITILFCPDSVFTNVKSLITANSQLWGHCDHTAVTLWETLWSRCVHVWKHYYNTMTTLWMMLWSILSKFKGLKFSILAGIDLFSNLIDWVWV